MTRPSPTAYMLTAMVAVLFVGGFYWGCQELAEVWNPFEPKGLAMPSAPAVMLRTEPQASPPSGFPSVSQGKE